jgi:hypothetical protein
VGARHDAELASPAEWQEVAAQARQAGDSKREHSAVINGAMLQLTLDPATAVPMFEALAPDVDAQRLHEDACWLDYLRGEAHLVLGDWDAVMAAGVRVMDAADRHGFDRVLVRTLHSVLPVAARRGDRQVLERAARWFEPRRAAFPRSPYADVHRLAADVHLQAAGLLDRASVRLDDLRDGLALGEGGPSWLTGIEVFIDEWLARGDVASARDALGIAAAAGSGKDPLGRAALALFQVIVDAESAVDAGETVAAAARRAIGRCDALGARWWGARGRRLLANLTGDPVEAAEAAAAAATLERRLGLGGHEDAPAGAPVGA